jgi:hypothetical protein
VLLLAAGDTKPEVGGGGRGGKQLWNGGWNFHEQLTPMHIPFKSLPMRFADDPFAYIL